MSPSRLFLAAALSAGCQPKAAEGPCANLSFGAIADPTAALHVSADGAAGAAATADAPIDTIAEALDRAAGGEADAIFIGPGSFSDDPIVVDDSHPAGLQISGCGADETVLETSDETFLAYFSGAAVAATLQELTFSGGDRSLRIDGGADVTASGLSLEAPMRTGVVVIGSDTVLELTDTTVTDPIPGDTEDAGEIGYGISIDTASVALSGVTVEGATAAGIVAVGSRDTTTLSMSSVTVRDTVDSDGQYGRGVHLQSLASAELSELTVQGCSDAGVFAKQLVALSLHDSELIDVASAEISSDGTEESGDGVTVTSRSGPGDTSNTDPGDYTVSITGTTFSGVARRDILLERVAATVSDNTEDAGFSAQDDADIGGTDTVEELSEEEALGMNYTDLSTTLAD